MKRLNWRESGSIFCQMASKMPAEVLEMFKKEREETKAPSGEEMSGKKDSAKRAKEKARKFKSARAQ